MRRSWRTLLMLVVALPLAAGLTAAAAAPQVKPPTPSASIQLSYNNQGTYCYTTLTYTWSNFKSVAAYNLAIYKLNSGGGYTLVTETGPRPAGGSGTVYQPMSSFSGTGTSYTFYGVGTLLKANGNLVPGSERRTPDQTFTCPV